jgi:hypothetical protein
VQARLSIKRTLVGDERGDTMKQQPERKSIFDQVFYFLKIPIEVLRLEIVSDKVKRCNPQLEVSSIPRFSCPEGPDFNQFFERLSCADQIILSRVIFWTRKGLACTHSNAQFGELINQSEDTARGIVRKLIRHKLTDVFYPNRRSRELTALVGVKPEHVTKRKAAQAAKSMGTGSQGGVNPLTSKGQFDGNPLTPTTTEITNKQLSGVALSLAAEGQPKPRLKEKDETATSEQREAILEKTKWGREYLEQQRRKRESRKERKRKAAQNERKREAELQDRKQKQIAALWKLDNGKRI